MKRILIAVVACSCAAHLTQPRKGWEKCEAKGPSVSCNGKEMMRVECGTPASNGCRTLTAVYADGQRVVLADHGAVFPELSSDGARIWYRDPAITTDLWNVYDARSGVVQQLDSGSIDTMRAAGAVPLWPGGKP